MTLTQTPTRKAVLTPSISNPSRIILDGLGDHFFKLSSIFGRYRISSDDPFWNRTITALANRLKLHGLDDGEHLDGNFSKTFFLKSHYHFGSVSGTLIPSLQGRCPSDLDNNSFQRNLLKLLDLDDDGQLDDNFSKTYPHWSHQNIWQSLDDSFFTKKNRPIIIT